MRLPKSVLCIILWEGASVNRVGVRFCGCSSERPAHIAWIFFTTPSIYAAVEVTI